MQRWRSAGHSPTDERGQATFTLVLVVVVVAIAVVLLYRTAWTADSINKKAGTIAKTAGGINTSTQAVLKLGRTNQLASSILDTAKPLQGQLDQVIGLAHSIDGLATSINDGVAQINTNLDTTLALAAKIKADTGNILGQADTANHFASCIDRGLLTSTGNSAC